MFRYYLTYQFAMKFESMCSSIQLPLSLREVLVREARSLVQHFGGAVSTKDPAEEAREFHAAFGALSRAERILAEAGIEWEELQGCAEVLRGRLEKLCAQRPLELEFELAGSRVGAR